MNRNKRGQVLFEYLVLLFVAVLLVLGFIYQFNDAFRQYANAWFGNNEGGYLFCLIENGYLPGESENCTMPSFSLKNGKSLSQGLGGGGNGAYKSTAWGASGGGGGSGLGGGPGRAREGQSGQLVPGPAFAGGGSASGAKDKAATGNNGFSSGNTPAIGYELPPGSSRSSNLNIIPFHDIADSLGGATRSKPIPANEHDLKSPRTIAMEKARAKKKAEDDLNANFALGKMFKYVIIFLIVFGIIFFVGSQFFAIARSGRKRD